MEIVTPHDPEARYSQKATAAGRRDWIGCRDHQTETCDELDPDVIVQVVTRPAPQQDIDALGDILQQLTRQGFQPPRARRRRAARCPVAGSSIGPGAEAPRQGGDHHRRRDEV